MSIYRLDLKRNLGELISWTVVFAAIIAIMMFLHSMFGSVFKPESFAARTEALPNVVRGILGLTSSPDLSQPFQFAAYIYQFILLFSGIYACLIGAKAFTGEEGKGTIEFLYSLPVSRGNILRQKIASGIVRYFIYSLVLFIVTCVMTWFLNRDMNISGVVIAFIRVFICTLFTGYVYMSVGFLISALFRSNAESISVALALVLITYIIGMLGKIMTHMGFLAYLSPIHAELPLVVLNHGFGPVGLILGLVVIIVTTLLTTLRYKKKDFLV